MPYISQYLWYYKLEKINFKCIYELIRVTQQTVNLMIKNNYFLIQKLE